MNLEGQTARAARSAAAEALLQFLLGARSTHCRRSFVTLLNRLPLDGMGFNRTALSCVTALSSPLFCFPFEYLKILRFKPTLPAISFPRTTHCSTATSQGATILDL